MFHGVSHVDVPVTNLKRAARLWAEGTGFPVTSSSDVALDIDASSTMLRLHRVDRVLAPASVRLQCQDVVEAARMLQAFGAILEPGAPKRSGLELELIAWDADGNRIALWRPLTEDEYDTDPDLDTTRTWLASAERLLNSLLKSVPALFRGLARRKVVAMAEEIARSTVTEDDVVRAFILASSRPTRSRVVEPLRRHGFDPERYREDFEA